MKSARLIKSLALSGILLVLAACSQPAQVPTLEAPVASVTALSNPGTVSAWGYNADGQASVPSGLSNVVAIAGGSGHSLALLSNGNPVVWGSNSYGQATIPLGVSNLTAIAAGADFNLGLKNDGSVVGWGRNTSGQTSVPTGLTNVRSIAAGFDHSLALKTDGTVVAWGSNQFGQVNIPLGLSGIKAISAGNGYSLALRNDGTVLGWGYNSNGQTNIPLGLSNVVAISAGYLHGVALKFDGTVVAWGNNDFGQTNVPVGLSNVVDISGGGFHTLARKADGSLVGWGVNANGQISFPALGNVSAIAAGWSHSLALISTPLDSTAPSANPSIGGTLGNNGWYKSDVVIHWNWSDNPGGLGIDPTNCTTSSTVTTEGTQTISALCKDLAGNTGSASLNLKVDKTLPTLNPVVSPNPVLLGATASASANASDATSGLASQSCAPVVTSSVGAKTVNCTVSDHAGNNASKTASYSVIYNFSFASPVAALPSLNQVKAGALIPINFSLSGNQGTAVLAGSPTSQPIACDVGPTNIISQTLKNGAGSLSYSTAANTYTYVWKTETKAWINTCRQLSLTLADGQTYRANFKFVR